MATETPLERAINSLLLTSLDVSVEALLDALWLASQVNLRLRLHESTEVNRVRAGATTTDWWNPKTAQSQRIVNEKAKEKYVYRRYATPWEVLRELTLALPQDHSYRKPTRSIASLDQAANAYSETESAQRRRKANRTLFTRFQPNQVNVKAHDEREAAWKRPSPFSHSKHEPETQRKEPGIASA